MGAIQNLQPLAYAVASVTFFFGTITIFLRFYCRLLLLRTWGWDDWISVLIFLVSIGQQIILYMFLHYGCGLHIAVLDGYHGEQIIKWLFIEEVFYYCVHFVIKNAFLFFYLRLSPDKNFRLMVFLGFGTNAAIFVINVLMAFFQCVPMDEIFHPGTHPNAFCIEKLVLLIVPSILNIFQDLYILLLPIRTVWGLQMSLRRKIAVLSIIGFGASAVLVAALRLIPLFEMNSSPDLSFVLGKMVIVAAVEVQLAIVAVNLPSLKALWTKLTGGSSSGSGKGYSDQKGYKLSSMEPGRSKKKSKHSRGSITALEQGLSSTESEEELFRQTGTTFLAPGGIKVTKMVDVKMTDRLNGDSDIDEKQRYNGVSGSL
ncbi:hypothetical protein GQ43DRAFT_10513 [Delitschia confertaspora ATCC 74209]|uniref:Rhodopsin domain-containing protein n=1 Tax=Delitschia confertaspora ATCC 74209 TaxID=1513339 RepID=A0A9P4MZN6_9PLEO|nr:hypothetical protein GQ43DRAFT_10513 [Delitschia confertaspora ATCC 74209]